MPRTAFVYQERDRTSRIELIVLCPTNVDANGIAWQSFHFTAKDRLPVRPCRAVGAWWRHVSLAGWRCGLNHVDGWPLELGTVADAKHAR
jgi:hypothetical protein